MKFRSISLLAIFCLTACSRHSPADSIDFVKEQESTVRGFTFGQILESKKFCKTRNWSASQDDFGRDIVAFDCGIEISKDAVDKLSSDAVASLEKRAAEKARECHVDPQPFVEANAAKLANYFGQFSSATVRPVFVIYKRQLADATVLMLDAAGRMARMSQESTSLLAANFVKANNPYDADTDIRPVYAALMYSAPLSDFTCLDLKQAVLQVPVATEPASAPDPKSQSEAPEARRDRNN